MKPHPKPLLRLAPLLALLLAVACQSAAPPVPDAPPQAPAASKEDIAPEAASGLREVKPVQASGYMVGAANPYAARAGQQIMERGGNATDAVIAMSLVLTLVEPQSSGIGGGAFLVMRQADGAMTTWDGREAAPAAATPDMFMDQGKPRDFMKAVVGGLSVGTPGLLRMLESAHKAHGKLPWAELFTPAIELAQEGFTLSPRLHLLLEKDPALAGDATARAYFYQPNGEPKPVGTVLKNPELAQTLRAVAQGGADAFYTGPIAQDIVEAVQKDARSPGRLSLEDLASYQAKQRPAVCAPYRAFEVCGMGPPSSGGVTPLQILGILENFDLPAMDQSSPQALHLLAEASRLAFADRGLYLADSDFVDVPVQALLDPAYLKRRAALIQPGKAMDAAAPGQPVAQGALQGMDASPELPSTSHMVAVDRDGNAISMTASIENAFGSRLMVRGFLLNNELTDFSFVPEQDGKPVANRVQPGKRPRSSMAPLIVVHKDSHELRLVIGSPGGSRIIGYVTRATLGVLDAGLDIQASINRPHVLNRNGATEVEATPGPQGESMAAALRQMGHEVKLGDLNSGLQGIERLPDGTLRGGADPRREGLILGPPQAEVSP